MYRRQDKQEGRKPNAFLEALAREVGVDEVQIWPENWPVFQLFASLATQWRSGMGGPTGLCYEAVYPLLDRLATSPAEWDQLFEDIRLMEREALSVMQEALHG